MFNKNVADIFNVLTKYTNYKKSQVANFLHANIQVLSWGLYYQYISTKLRESFNKVFGLGKLLRCGIRYSPLSQGSNGNESEFKLCKPSRACLG